MDGVNLQAISPVQVNPNMRGGVLNTPPIDLAAGVAQTLYSGDIAADQYLQYMRIQNVGTGTVKVMLNDTATAAKYNFLLRVDTGAEAGAGGACEIFGAWDISKVSVISGAGSKIAIVKISTPRSALVNNY